MKFSIIITFYNKKNYIKECLDSVLEQSYQNFEIIIVDDYSNTNESFFLKEIVYNKINSNKIKLLINPKNLGPSYSRNLGIENSTGEILIFLDADDRFTPNYLFSLNNTFVNIDNCNIVISTSFELKGQVYRPNYLKLINKGYLRKIPNFEKIYTTKDFISTFIFDPIFCGGGNLAIKKESINNLRFDINERNFEDWLFYYYACSSNLNKIFFLNNKEGILYNNYNENSLSRKKISHTNLKIPFILSDTKIEYEFRRYVYFNWYYSILKRLNSSLDRATFFYKYFDIKYFNPFPIWKFFLPSILLIFNLDYFIDLLSKYRKKITYV